MSRVKLEFMTSNMTYIIGGGSVHFTAVESHKTLGVRSI